MCFRSTRLSLINLQVEPTRAKGQQALEVMPRSICCEKIAQPNKGGSQQSWESQGVPHLFNVWPDFSGKGIAA